MPRHFIYSFSLFNFSVLVVADAQLSGMEVFAVAANVMAAVSLTLQLVDTLENINEFWKGVRDAPEEVEQILCDLQLLKGILGGLRRAVQLRCPGGPDPLQISSVLAALQQCQRHIGRMTEFANDLQDGFATRPLVTRFKTALRKPKVAEFSRHLEQAKTTLLLAINVASFMVEEHCFERVLQQFSHLRSDIEMKFVMQSIPMPTSPPPSQKAHFQQNGNRNIKHYRTINATGHQLSASDVLLWLLQLPPQSSYRRYIQKTGRIIGQISWRASKQRSWDDATLKRSQVVTIHLPILKRSFTVQSQWALGQWTHTFRVTRIVPDTSSIFRLCATGDETIIRQVFDAGLASPFDQTTSGITLLHVAAAGYRYDIYKLLRDCRVEYSLCEHPKYGKLAPVELTQDFVIFAEGTYQTVQEWLTISNEESAIWHPEDHYQNVVGIWNSSIETQGSMTDEAIMTLLQGPLRLPRQQRCSALDIQAKTPSTGAATMPTCSSSLFLFCYYFLFHGDPYGHEVSKAWLHSSSFKDSAPVPLYEYLSQYWHGEEWVSMLLRFNDLDFRGLSQRQQDKFPGFSYVEPWDCDRGKWVRKKRALFKFGRCEGGEPGVWIGPLGDCQAVFEFEDPDCGDDVLAENEGSDKLAPNAFPPVPETIAPAPKFRPDLILVYGLNLVITLSQQLLISGIIVSVTLISWLYLCLYVVPLYI